MIVDERLGECESDRLLRKAGALGKGTGIYTESDLIGDHYRHVSDVPLDELDEALSLEKSHPTSSSRPPLLSVLTPKQKKAAKLLHEHGNQEAVARKMGILQPAVSKILERAEQRIVDFLAVMDDEREEVSCIGEWLWRAEQATKKRQIYRHTTHPLQVKNYGQGKGLSQRQKAAISRIG